MWTREVVSVNVKVDAKDSEGFTYSAELKRTGDSASAK